MTTKYTQNTLRQAPRTAYKPLPTPCEYQTTRVCECCGQPLKATARRDARYCSETCRGRAHDARHPHRAHTAKGGTP